MATAREVIEAYDVLVKRAVRAAAWVKPGADMDDGALVRFRAEDDGVLLEWPETDSYDNGMNVAELRLPWAVLDMSAGEIDEWGEEMAARREAAERQHAEIIARLRAEECEAQERAEYERLKAKFGGRG